MPKVAFKQSDVVRVLKAARKAGVENPSVDISPDGTIRLLTESAPRGALTPLQEWERKRGLSDA